jgi:hypothetical protein
MWILNGNDITVKCKIAIGLKKSKYDKNEVNLDNIADSIHKYYDVMLPITYDIANLPQSICQQQEQEYRKFVESKCPNIKFDYPVYNQLVYDFTVNGHKVQEKVGTYRKDRNETVIFTLHKSNGKQDGVRKFKIYNECDNDFYWLNFPDKKHFYIFPEMELIKLGILSTEKQKGSGIIYITMSKISNTKYGVKYLFDYENLDESRIMELFKREHIIP